MVVHRVVRVPTCESVQGIRIIVPGRKSGDPPPCVLRCERTEEVTVPCAIKDVELVKCRCRCEDVYEVRAGYGDVVCPVRGVYVCEGCEVVLDLLAGCWS